MAMSMSLDFTIQTLITYLCIMVVSGGGSDLSCCHHVLKNSSAEYILSEAPDPDCTTQWNINDYVLVDVNGNEDNKKVLFSSEKKLMLLSNFSGVLYKMECPHIGVSKPVNCTDLCQMNDVNDDSQAGRLNFAIIIPIIVFFFLLIGFIVYRTRKNWKKCFMEKVKGDHQLVKTSPV